MLAGMSLDVFSFIFINTHSQICKSPLFIPIEFTCPMTVPSVPLWSETQPKINKKQAKADVFLTRVECLGSGKDRQQFSRTC